MQGGVGPLILDVMPIYRSCLGYRHTYSIFYQFPNSNLFTRRMLFSREKPLVKSTTPEPILHHICFPIYYLPLLFSDLLFQKPKNTLLHFLFASFIYRDLFIQSTQFLSRQLDNFWRRYPKKGIDNPL